MAQTEAEQFIHTEAERTEMLYRMQAIAGKDEMPAEDLEEIYYLILDRDADQHDVEYGLYDSMRILPNHEQPAIALGPSNRESHEASIILLDGLDRARDTGEDIRSDQEDGHLMWRVGLINSMYSEFLGRRVLVDVGEYVMAADPLTDREHAILAKRLVENYTLSIKQEHTPR